MSRVTALCVLVVLVIGVAAAAAGAAGSAQRPSWSLQAAQVVAGQAFSLKLDPHRARVCWVGVSGPSGIPAVGWKFDVKGRELNLTLLTHKTAAPGPWSLKASCRGASHALSGSKMSIQIVSSGGNGALVSHGDMRVAVLPQT